MKYQIKTRCEATVIETWSLDWPHDEPPTEDEIDEMISNGDGAVEFIRERTEDVLDREIESIAWFSSPNTHRGLRT